MTDDLVISVKVTSAMRNGLDKLAKEYNVTRSEMMRILIVEVIDDDLDDDTRQYSRRKNHETGGTTPTYFSKQNKEDEPCDDLKP